MSTTYRVHVKFAAKPEGNAAYVDWWYREADSADSALLGVLDDALECEWFADDAPDLDEMSSAEILAWYMSFVDSYRVEPVELRPYTLVYERTYDNGTEVVAVMAANPSDAVELGFSDEIDMSGADGWEDFRYIKHVRWHQVIEGHPV